MSENTIRIAGTVNDSIVDGPGFRFTIFTQGCPHNCFGCHNPQTHDFNGGKFVTCDSLLEQIYGNPLLDGVTFSGGEPFCQAKPLFYIGEQLKKKGYNIMIYTGYVYEYLMEHSDVDNYYKELLSVCDYLVDGKFEIDKKSYELKFKGSSNQRIIDCKKTAEENKICLVEL